MNEFVGTDKDGYITKSLTQPAPQNYVSVKDGPHCYEELYPQNYVCSRKKYHAGPHYSHLDYSTIYAFWYTDIGQFDA